MCEISSIKILILSIFLGKYLVASSKYILFYFDGNMSFRSTRSCCDDYVPVVDRLIGNLECGYALEDEMAKFFDIASADLQQLLLIKVSVILLLGDTSSMNMTEICRDYIIEETTNFQDIIVGEVLCRNAILKNDVEYLVRKVIFDLYRIGFSMITGYKK